MTVPIIRPMCTTDIPACLAIASEGWDRFTAQCAQPDLEAMFSSAAWKPFFYIAEQDGNVVGMGGYAVSWLCYGVYDLFWHAVRKTHRRRGIGQMLVNHRLNDLRPIADVVMLATTIPEYYSKYWGFQTVAKLKTTENYGDHLMLLNFK